MSEGAPTPAGPVATRKLCFVSVIIPVYNASAYLSDALDSVLQEHHDQLEIIVVDDGSTDGSAEIATTSGPFVRYCYQANRGPAAARNQGLQVARGDVVGFIDADDRWCPGRLAAMLAALDAGPAGAAGRRADHGLPRQVVGREELEFRFGHGGTQYRGRSVFVDPRPVAG